MHHVGSFVRKNVEAEVPKRGCHPTQKALTMQCIDTNIFLTLSVSFFVSYSRVDCVCASVHELIMDSNMISAGPSGRAV